MRKGLHPQLGVILGKVRPDFAMLNSAKRQDLETEAMWSVKVSIDLDVVGDDLFGWEDHQFRFGQVQLKVVIFHPRGYISETVRNPRRDRGILRRARQKQLSIIGITVVEKPMRADDRAQRGGVNGKEQWSHHRALGHPSGEAVRYRQLTLP